MIKYQKAIKIINKISFSLNDEKISTLNSLNRVCSKNVLSSTKNPLSNNTAFDGFALLSKETKGLSRKKFKKFKILKSLAAGDNPKIKNYQKNSSIEVMTGAIIPKPYDTIIPVEKVKYFPSKKKPTHIVVDHEVKKFSFIRFAGEDFNLREIIIKKGELIQPKHIMALTTLGVKNLYVKKKPKIIFFGTGKEIVDYKKKSISNWEVRNSNNYYFLSFGKSLHYEILNGGIIKDNQKKKLKEKLKKYLSSDIDIFATSGAISAGKFDFIPELIKKIGFKTYFKGVTIKPGRPIMLSKSRKKNKLFFGLPGNPISCAAGFRFFIYPLLRKGLGMEKEEKFRAKIINQYLKRKDFTHFARCLVNVNSRGTVELRVLQEQQSHRIKSFAKANCWGIFPSGKDQFKPGDIIEWVPLIPSS